jgi:hypothetical protein
MTPDKIEKIKALMNDPASTPNEKEICARILSSLGEEPLSEKDEKWRESMFAHLSDIWYSRFGEPVKISDMDTSYLANTIFFIRRNTDIPLSILEEVPVYVNMTNELIKRGFGGLLINNAQLT